MNLQLGIDIGGTGMKGALIDIDKGEMFSERKKYLTPQPASPENMIPIINQILEDFEWKGKDVGIGFPSIVKNGICYTANNIDKAWIGTNFKTLVEKECGSPCHVLNDADAAGLAEVQYGNGKGIKDNLILITLGTGIGSSMFLDGKLLQNIELGSLIYGEEIAEYYVSNKARIREDMSWPEYGKKLNKYLTYINNIFNPSKIILGGGISKKLKKYKDQFDPKLNIEAAKLLNNAGIIGAAYYAILQKESN